MNRKLLMFQTQNNEKAIYLDQSGRTLKDDEEHLFEARILSSWNQILNEPNPLKADTFSQNYT